MTNSIITPDLVDLRLEAASRQVATRSRLVHASFREALTAAPDAQTVVDLVTKEVLGQ